MVHFEDLKAFKENLRKKSQIKGSWITLSHPSIVEIFSNLNFDAVVIDNEHSMINPQDVQNNISLIQGQQKAALVRIAQLNPVEIKKTLDAGASGIICPMINSIEDAQNFIQYASYPPTGIRPYGLSRAQGYGLSKSAAFLKSNESIALIAQIEHALAIENFEKILSIQELDGFLIGPYDLSGSYGVPGQLDHKLVTDAEKYVLSCCKNKNISVGIHLVHPTEKLVKEKLELGYNLIFLGTDIHILSTHAKEYLEY